MESAAFFQDMNLGGSSQNERLLKLEEEIVNIHAKIDALTKKPKVTRKNSTISDLDAKLCTILDILAKVVVPP